MFAGLRKPTDLIVIVITLVAYGCPVQAIVHAFGLDERTVASWRERAGQHCEQVHQALVEQGQLDLVHVQADEIRVKGCKMTVWMGLALMVSTRLWLAGTVSLTRDTALADRLMRASCDDVPRVCGRCWCAPMAGQHIPTVSSALFGRRVKETAGRGRACLRVWPQLHIGTVIKHTVKHRLSAITRRMAHGSLKRAAVLLRRSRGGTMLNTAFIERFNGTMRQRLATLTRKCRHAARRLETLQTGMYLLGTTYNFCWPHHELSHVRESATGKRHVAQPRTPAMAAGLTDHVWSVSELLCYKIAPAFWVAPKRRGRPRTRPFPDPTRPKRPRKQVLCATTN